ncbi:monooxygenase [Sorangium atrum]|uniref:C-type cytochrome n=1 Tax=Sorangium atrum TaxID=2995308 RepID=A0ABT5CDI3_9BACT|nr:c-type cytochrome [Sorangium aterium]MDC0684510.1 c-type cytochrome [Sorangium aterium]
MTRCAGTTGSWARLAAALAALSACGGDDAGAAAGGGVQAAVSYYRDVKPIFDARCAGCHSDGGVAPFSLERHETAASWAASIKRAVVERTMPPWPADNACAEYVGDRSLSEQQIQTIAAWVDGGAALGDPADEGPPIEPPASGALARVDRTLEMPVEYTPQTGPDEYRCFVIDWPEEATRYVTGFGIRPGEQRVVHHVIAFIAAPDQLAELDALDASDPGPGYPCYGGPGLKPRWLGGWVPGGGSMIFPPGAGTRIEPGSRLILQVHYNTLTAGKLPDRTAIDVTLESSVEREGTMQPWANPAWLSGDSMMIPALESDVVHRWGADPSRALADNAPIEIHWVGLHMHTLGTRARLEIERAGGGSECVLDIPRWDFHWQGNYKLAEPKVLEPGDKLSIECHWDNTPEKQPIIDGQPRVPRDVVWGEGTTDEMCLGTFYMTGR